MFQSEPGPRSLARKAEAEAAEAKDHDESRAVADPGLRGGLARATSAAPADSKVTKGTTSWLTDSNNRGDEELLAQPCKIVHSLESDKVTSSVTDLAASPAAGQSSDGETATGLNAEEVEDVDELEDPSPKAPDSASAGARPRTRERRSIKRPARYEEWLAEASQEADEHQFLLPAVHAAGRSSQPKRAKGGAGSAPVFAVPRGVRRKDEAFTPGTSPPETVLPRSNVKGGGASAARRRRLMPWLDLAAVEAAVACGGSVSTEDSDRAIAAGVAAAAAAAAAVAASAVVPQRGCSEGQGQGIGDSFYDGLQQVLRRARDALSLNFGTNAGSVSSAARNVQHQCQGKPGIGSSGLRQNEQAVTSASDEILKQSIAPLSGKSTRNQQHQESRQREQQQELSLPASATQWPTLTHEFEKAAERAAKEAAAFVASSEQTRGVSTGNVGPDMVRKFLLKHGRKPPQPAMRAPPQRAHQQLQMIQEQLLEQHRQHRIRQEQRMQQQQRSRNCHQQKHHEGVNQEGTQGHQQLRLQLAQEQRARQQQGCQEMEPNQQPESLELKLIRSARSGQGRPQSRNPSSSSAQTQRAQRGREEQLNAQRQESRIMEQLKKLELLGSIDALFSRQHEVHIDKECRHSDRRASVTSSAAANSSTAQKGKDRKGREDGLSPSSKKPAKK